MNLNGTLIKTLRIESGMSPTITAATAGITVHVLNRIENNDPNATRMITVNGLNRLADSLHIQPTNLFTTPSPTNSPTTPPPSDDTLRDAHALAGLLLRAKTQVGRANARQALDWNATRFNAAANTLSTLLANTGIRLHNSPHIGLAPTEQARAVEATARLTTARQNKRGIDATTARVLRDVLEGRLSSAGRVGAHTRAALAALTHSGAITATPGGHQPSTALIYALAD